MKRAFWKSLQKNVLPTVIVGVALLVSGCMQGQSSSGKKTKIKDFSIVTEFTGCPESFLMMDVPSPNECAEACSEGTHAATIEELAELKKELIAEKNEGLLDLVNGSRNVCLSDVQVEKRPTKQIEIKNDFCSCLGGKSDIINDCEQTCAGKPSTNEPLLYVNTIIGPEIYLNDKIKNLYNWCSVQLASDDTAPQCALSATDGASTVSIPINITPGSNSFTANINALAFDRTYVVKIVEAKAGSEAESKEFQIRRKKQSTTDDSTGILKVANISQYSCLQYGGRVDSAGIIRRYAETFIRNYYYFPANETPAPMAPVISPNESLFVCHDEQLHPGNDNIEYPRFEHIPMAFTLWSKSDSRFATSGSKMAITTIIENRLANEYPGSGITGASLFTSLSIANRPGNSTQPVLGVFMIPFTDSVTKKSYCPSASQLQNPTNPLFAILADYVVDTEGLFLAEKEAEVVLDSGSYKTLYGTILVPESVVKNYGFYIENGLRIKANEAVMSTKTIHFYWPVNPTADPLLSGGRKLFTVRSKSTLAGQSPVSLPTEGETTDKRIGCIPKSAN